MSHASDIATLKAEMGCAGSRSADIVCYFKYNEYLKAFRVHRVMNMCAWQVSSTAVTVAAMFAAVAPPVAAAAAIGIAWTGVYNVLRSVNTLADRSRHEQSTGLEDAESRNCWLSLAASTLGFASSKGVQYLTKLTQNGQVLSR
jgi:hypothetical protein